MMLIRQKKPLPMRFITQYAVKAILLLLAITACANAFRISAFSGGAVLLPSLSTAVEAGALAALLTGVQWLLFSGIFIKRMALLFRCALATVCSVPLITGAGMLFGWFKLSIYLVTVLLPVFSVSTLVGASVLAWMYVNEIHGVKQLATVAFRKAKKNATAYLAAFVIGMSAGYRGSSELEKPWQDTSIVISEIDERDNEQDAF